MFSAHTGLLSLLLGVATLATYPFSHNSLTLSDEGLHGDNLLQKYIAVSAQPMPERIRLMQNLSASERSFLWRVHLALFVTQRPDLTKDQQSVVLDTLTIATPQLFTAPDANDPTWRSRVHEPVERLRTRGLQLFEKTEAAEIFSMMGERQQEIDALRKYLSLSEQKRANRREMFLKYSAQEKSELWHVHFALSLAQHTEWNEQQRALVLEASSMASPTLYRTPKDAKWKDAVDEPARVLMQRALLIFDRSEATAIFAELGGKEPLSHHPKPKPSDKPSCECSHDSDWCVSYDCYSNNCNATASGCGTLWLYPCTGRCYSPPPINN